MKLESGGIRDVFVKTYSQNTASAGDPHSGAPSASCAYRNQSFFDRSGWSDADRLQLHHLYDHSAHLEFHGHLDCDGGIPGADHCRCRIDRRPVGNSQ